MRTPPSNPNETGEIIGLFAMFPVMIAPISLGGPKIRGGSIDAGLWIHGNRLFPAIRGRMSSQSPDRIEKRSNVLPVVEERR